MDEKAFADFFRKWTVEDYPPIPTTLDALNKLEQATGIALPSAYRQFLLAYGIPQITIGLLDAIVEREIDIRDVSDFYEPLDAAKVTETWRSIGLREDLVVFASDCSGNKFCFSTKGYLAGPVWFFDHDDGEVELAAESFEAWIAAFAAIEPWEGS